MKKGITANGKHSYNDFKLEIAERKLTPPSPNKITEEIPYMNGQYDFSSLNGEITLKNRNLYYEFDISELTTEDMEKIKSSFLTWLYQINETEIVDDYLSDYYFVGSFESVDWSEDFGKGVIGVTFSVYPYKISLHEEIIDVDLNGENTLEINTNSSHNIFPKITTSGDLNIEINENSYSLSAGTYEDTDVILKSGTNYMKLSGNTKISISYRDEVI
jgi:hypothetical protein